MTLCDEGIGKRTRTQGSSHGRRWPNKAFQETELNCSRADKHLKSTGHRSVTSERRPASVDVLLLLITCVYVNKCITKKPHHF